MSEYTRFVPPGGSGASIPGSEEEAGAGGTRTSGSDEEGRVEAHRAQVGRMRAFRATGGLRGTHLRK